MKFDMKTIGNAVLLVCMVVFLPGELILQETHQHEMHGNMAQEHSQMSTPLTEPGNAIFGTIQEAIRKLEADPETDWSEVDMEALRQHLIDMRNVAIFVDVSGRREIDDGLRIRVDATTEKAAVSLDRVLQAHPSQLKRETGWEMRVRERESGYIIRVTTENPEEVEKIRGLGYIGLLAYGAHHQQHHWMLLQSKDPHK